MLDLEMSILCLCAPALLVRPWLPYRPDGEGAVLYCARCHSLRSCGLTQEARRAATPADSILLPVSVGSKDVSTGSEPQDLICFNRATSLCFGCKQ